MKLGNDPQNITQFVSSTGSAAHIRRQFGTAVAFALTVLGGLFIAGDSAGASNPIALLMSLTSGQVGNAPQDPGKVDEKKSESTEEQKPAIDKDVKNVKELEPLPLVNEWMRGTRPHRDPVPELSIKKHKLAQKPSADEMRKYGELKKLGAEPKSKEDLELIDKVVKYQVYSMTDPDWYQPNVEARKHALDEMRRNRDEIEKTLEAKGGMNEKFVTIYKQTATKYLAELLDNHLWVRANAMRLLGMVKDEQTIRLFVANIEDPKQHEAIKFFAMEGIESLGQKRLIGDVQLEIMAVSSLLNTLKKNDQVHPFTRQAAVRALGAIGRPTRVVGRNDADVAVALLKIVRDPNIRRLDRNDAVIALANLQIQPELDYNFQYVAYEIAQFAADVGAAALQNPSTDDLYGHLFLVEASNALAPEQKTPRMPLAERAKKHPMAGNRGDVTYVRAVGQQVNRVAAAGLKAYKPEAITAVKGAAQTKPENVAKKNKEIAERLHNGEFKIELAKLNELLKNNPPRSMRLTPDTDELGPPPALVGPAAPVAKEPDGNEKSGDKPAGPANSQDQ